MKYKDFSHKGCSLFTFQTKFTKFTKFSWIFFYQWLILFITANDLHIMFYCRTDFLSFLNKEADYHFNKKKSASGAITRLWLECQIRSIFLLSVRSQPVLLLRSSSFDRFHGFMCLIMMVYTIIPSFLEFLQLSKTLKVCCCKMKQGRIHGYPRRVRVGRGSDRGGAEDVSFPVDI